MLAPLVVCVLGMAALASPAEGSARRFAVEDAASVRALFERFEREHGRRYSDPRERRARLAIFKDNLARINQLNEKDPHAEYGITKFTDLSPEEYIQKYKGYNRNPRKTDRLCEIVTTVPDIDAPDSFDWREHGAVALPKDQADCGSCWAFAVIANVEGQYAIKHKKLVTFSEQQLVSCDNYDSGCDGGLEVTAIPALMEMGGVQADNDYPYVSGVNNTVHECKMDKNKFKAKVIGCKEFYHENVTEDDIKSHLYSNGPLTINIDPNVLGPYRNGVITNCEGTSIIHAVVLVGYGTAADDGVPYWIVRDHGGPDTGENGYFRMKRGVNCLGFMHKARNIMSSVVDFDVRGKHLSEARHWSAPEVFGPRAYFSTSPPPASLLVRDVKRHDEGVYRCRVDFRNTQTTSFRYNLTVVVPPEKPVVVNRWGRVINTTTLGPHEEGEDVLLTCRVLGGRPEPSVRWLVNGVLVDEEYEHNTGDVIENRLLWPQISRTDYAAVFTCQATNSQLTAPKELSLVLDMFLKPLTVEINKPAEVGEGGVLTAERRYEVTCESAGSRPPAVITWFKGKRQLKRITEELRDNMTVSVMSFVPTLDDDGKPITCRAENPNKTSLYLETSWTISVVYPPVVRLRLGSSLAAGEIKEGDDVYFECHVRANPAVRKLSWLHDDRPLAHNATARVFHSNQSLVLQKVTRHSSGRYACSALNAEGETVSNELHFRVKYSPSCRTAGVAVVGAARGESVVIVCEVDADPPAAVFKWKFNNSGETIDVQADRYTSNGSASSLKYTPVADLDYGTLSCSASNEVGSQLAPCVFQMVAAGKPHAPRNCTLLNQTADSVEVACVAGFDGGLPQRFLLEVYSGDQRVPRVNLSAEEPSWTVRGLEWDVRFRLVAVAVNGKGRSPPARLADVLFRDPEKRTASEAPLGVGGMLGAMGAGLGAVSALVAGACLTSLRRRRRTPNGKPPPAPLACNDAPKQPEHDDAEPDLIPNNYCEVPSAPSLTVSSPGRTAPAPLTTPACNGPGASWTWGARPRELGVGAEAPRAPTGMGRSASATLRAAADLNVDAIKEKLLDHRIPESCV